MVMVTFGDVAAHHRVELLTDHLQVGLRRGVHVRDALAQKHHRHGGVPVVDDGRLALVRRVPQHVVRILQSAPMLAGTWSLRHPMPVV